MTEPAVFEETKKGRTSRSVTPVWSTSSALGTHAG